MTDVFRQFADGVHNDQLFAGVDRLLIGCSGGGDSVALVDLLARWASDNRCSLAVAHLHHGWRGAEADHHRDLAAAVAEHHGLTFFERRVDLATAPGSREEAARNARLEFFADLGAEWNADAVAVGHTADDQLETVVLHLARGAHRRGLGGMHRRTEVRGVVVLRPLLDLRRGDLRAYAQGRSLQWGEDSSNDDISLSRNRLRRRLLKDLQQINPGAVDNVSRTAALMREEEEWLDGVADEALEALRVDEEFPGGIALDGAALAELPTPLRRRVVRCAIGRVRGHCRDISHEHVEWVIENNGVARDLPGVRVRREGPLVRLLPLTGRRLAIPGASG